MSLISMFEKNSQNNSDLIPCRCDVIQFSCGTYLPMPIKDMGVYILFPTKRFTAGCLPVNFLVYFRVNGRSKFRKKNRNFKRLKNREVSSDLDENLIELIAATQTFICKSFRRHTGSKNTFSNFFSREPLYSRGTLIRGVLTGQSGSHTLRCCLLFLIDSSNLGFVGINCPNLN